MTCGSTSALDVQRSILYSLTFKPSSLFARLSKARVVQRGTRTIAGAEFTKTMKLSKGDEHAE